MGAHEVAPSCLHVASAHGQASGRIRRFGSGSYKPVACYGGCRTSGRNYGGGPSRRLRQPTQRHPGLGEQQPTVHFPSREDPRYIGCPRQLMRCGISRANQNAPRSLLRWWQPLAYRQRRYPATPLLLRDVRQIDRQVGLSAHVITLPGPIPQGTGSNIRPTCRTRHTGHKASRQSGNWNQGFVIKSESPSTSNPQPLPPPKRSASSVSERLPNSEIEALRRHLREKSAWAQKEFERNPPIPRERSKPPRQ